MSADGPPVTSPKHDASLSDLLSELTQDLGTLMRQEVQLARVELQREATKATKAGAILAAAGVLGLAALLLILWAASWGLAEVMPAGLAFLVVALVVGIAAAAMAAMGRRRFQQVDPTPRTTLRTLKEDKEWLSNPTP